MATYEEMKRKYDERSPQAAGTPITPTTKTETPYEDLKQKYEERSRVVSPEEPKELKWEQYEGPDIISRQEEPLWRKAAKFVLPKRAEKFLGLEEPMPEITSREDIMKRYENAYAYEDLKRLQEKVEAGGGQLPKKTAGEVWKGVGEEPGKLLPFVAAVPTVKETYNLLQALKRIERGEEDYSDIYLVSKYGLEANRDSTFGAKVSEVLVNLPSFAGELLLTAGVFSVGKKGTEKIIKKTLVKTLGKKAGGLATRGVGTIVGGTLQTVPARFVEITAGTLQNMLPEYELSLNESNRLSVLINKEGDGVWEATAKSLGNEWVEVVSEHSGGLFTELAAPVKTKLMKVALFRAFLKLNPTAKADDFMELVRKAGWNGFLPEIGEERIGEVMRAAIGLEKYKLPSKEQLAVELVAFSIPGVTIGAMEKSFEQKGVPVTAKIREEVVEKPVTPPVIEAVKIDEMREGDAVVVSADKYKKKYNDYDPANHERYSEMSKELFSLALKETDSSEVIFTAGGAGSGKSELVVSQITKDFKFNGIVYDTVLESYDSFTEKANEAKKAGKSIRINAILPRTESAWKFTQKRAILTGRAVPLEQFVKGHTGFVETVLKIAKENPEVKIRLKDTRKIFKKKEARNAKYIDNKKVVVDTLSGSEYNGVRVVPSNIEKLITQLKDVKLSKKSKRKALAEKEAGERKVRKEVPRRYEEAKRTVAEKPEAIGKMVGGQRATGRLDERIKKSYQFFSPNVEEDLTFNQARKRLTSDDQATLKSISKDIDKELGMEGEAMDVIGDWSDGAENSIMVKYDKEIDPETNKYSVAQKGLVANQKSVILFDFDKTGPDTLYQIEIPEVSTMEELRKSLDELGLQFRTIVDNNKVVIFDPGSELTENINKLKKKYDKAIIKTEKGKGEFLGGETRSEGAKIFREVIKGYEQKVLRVLQRGEVSPDIRAEKPEVVRKVPEGKVKAPVEGEVLFVEKKGKPTKVAKSIEAKAEEKGIVEEFKGLAEYSPVVIKEQRTRIEKLMMENIDKAKRMAIGEESLDSNIKGAMLVKMMEDYAMDQKDGEFILELANSPLVSETSEAGQTLRLIREREPDSATAKMQEVKKERENAAKKKRKGKTKKQITDKMKKSLGEKISQKKRKVNKYAWESFINEITC